MFAGVYSKGARGCGHASVCLAFLGVTFRIQSLALKSRKNTSLERASSGLSCTADLSRSICIDNALRMHLHLRTASKARLSLKKSLLFLGSVPLSILAASTPTWGLGGYGPLRSVRFPVIPVDFHGILTKESKALA